MMDNNDLISRDELPKKAEEWLNAKLRLNYRRMKDELADPGKRESPRQDWMRIKLNREKQIILYMFGAINKAISNDAPVVYAEPVRHGRWMRLVYDAAWAKCSECGCNWEWGMVENCNMSYCPNCGAKMDGGEDNG